MKSNKTAYKPASWRAAQQEASPCVVYNHEATKIVRAELNAETGKHERVTEVQPPQGPLDLSQLDGKGPRSRCGRVLHGVAPKAGDYFSAPAPATKKRRSSATPKPPHEVRARLIEQLAEHAMAYWQTLSIAELRAEQSSIIVRASKQRKV